VVYKQKKRGLQGAGSENNTGMIRGRMIEQNIKKRSKITPLNVQQSIQRKDSHL